MFKKYTDHGLMLMSGAIAIFGFAPFNLTFILYISIFIIFFIINKFNDITSSSRALTLGFIFGLSYFNTQLYWIYYSIYYVIGAKFIVALIAQLGFTIYLALFMAIAFWCYNKLKTRFVLFNLAFLFPALWVIFDWLRGWLLGGFSWCDFGYSSVNLSFFRGIFPLLGEYGVTFLILHLLGIIYYIGVNGALSKSCLDRKTYRLVLIYILTVFLGVFYTTNVKYTKPYGKPVKIALLQGNVPVNIKWSDNSNLKIYSDMIKHAHASIIIIPETAIAKFEDDLPQGYISQIRQEAKKNKGELIAGMPKIIDDNDNYVNAAVLLTSPAEPYYAKYHLVPYGEYIPAKWLLGPIYKFVALPMVNFSRGGIDQKPLLVANEKLAFNICYENGFGGELIKSARNSTIMMNLSDMAWYGTTIAMYQHLQLSQARALENQRFFIQDTNTSITAVIDPEGRIQAKLPIFTRQILTDYVEGMVGETPFEIYGNWLIISVMFGIIGLAIFAKKLVRK